MKTLFTITLLLFCTSLESASGAGSERLNRAEQFVGPSPWQFGMEVELVGETALANLMPYMDFKMSREKLRRNLTTADVDSYLTTESFSRLPQVLQDSLSGGLGVEVKLELVDPKKIQLRPAANAGSSSVILSAQRQASVQNSAQASVPGAKTTATSLILPPGFDTRSQPDVPGVKPSDGLYVPEQVKSEQRWQAVLAKWKALPVASRIDVVDPQLLPREVKAHLVFLERDTQALTPKADLAPNVKGLLGRLNWNFEGGVVEFRHTLPLATKEEYLQDLRLFGDMTGLTRYIDDPANKFPPHGLRYTHHVHVSYYPEADGLMPIAERVNRLRLLEMAVDGRGGGAIAGDYGFTDVQGRSLIRLYSTQRLESRVHAEPPAREIDRITNYMRLPRDEARTLLEREIAAQTEILKKQIIETAEVGLTTTDSARRAALSEAISSRVTALVKAGPSDFKIDDVFQSVQSSEHRAKVSASALKLNESAAVFELLLPKMSQAEVRAALPQIIRAYAKSGWSHEFSVLLKRNEIAKSDVEALIMIDPLRALGLDDKTVKSSGVARFLRPFAPATQQAAWTALFESATNVFELKRATDGMDLFLFADRTSAESLTEFAQKTEARIFELTSGRPDSTGAYLRGIETVQAWSAAQGFVDGLNQASMSRMTTNPRLRVELLPATHVRRAQTEHKAALKTIFLSSEAETEAILRLEKLGEPLDYARIRRVVEIADGVNVETTLADHLLRKSNLWPEAKGGQTKQALFEAAEQGLLDPFLKRRASESNELIGSLVKQMTQAPKNENAFRFVKAALDTDPSLLKDRLALTGMLDSASRKPLAPPWNQLLMSHLSKVDLSQEIDFRISQFESFGQILTRYLSQNLQQGGPDGEAAAKIFDTILASPKVGRFFYPPSGLEVETLFKLRRKFPPTNFEVGQLSRIAESGPAGVDFVLDEIQRGRTDALPLLEGRFAVARTLRVGLAKRDAASASGAESAGKAAVEAVSPASTEAESRAPVTAPSDGPPRAVVAETTVDGPRETLMQRTKKAAERCARFFGRLTR